MIDTATLAIWNDWAKRDDWHINFVGSDIRIMLKNIGALRGVQEAAQELVNECQGDLTPSLGAMARLESAVHIAWKA